MWSKSGVMCRRVSSTNTSREGSSSRCRSPSLLARLTPFGRGNSELGVRMAWLRQQVDYPHLNPLPEGEADGLPSFSLRNWQVPVLFYLSFLCDSGFFVT